MAEKSFFVYAQILRFSNRKFNQVEVKKKLVLLHYITANLWNLTDPFGKMFWITYDEMCCHRTERIFFQITDLRKKFAVLKTLHNV